MLHKIFVEKGKMNGKTGLEELDRSNAMKEKWTAFMLDLCDANLLTIFFYSKDLMRDYFWFGDRIIEV